MRDLRERERKEKKREKKGKGKRQRIREFNLIIYMMSVKSGRR